MPNQASTPGRILIVDDDPSIIYFFEKTLKRDGHSIVSVTSGDAALQATADREFDVTLLDLKLKGMNGLEVLSKIHERWPATIVIIITAHASLDTAVTALREGAFDYLFKPCTIETLRTSVDRGLRKRREDLRQAQPDELTLQPAKAGPSAPLTALSPSTAGPGPKSPDSPPLFIQYHDLLIDPIRHVVTLGGIPLEVSVMEFDLVAYLAQEAPRVISASELVREVQHYNDNSPQARETIRSHVYHLRNKIRQATNRDVIRTVRGVGYVITME